MTYTHRNFKFQIGDRLWLRGKPLGQVEAVSVNDLAKEVELWVMNNWGKTFPVILWKNKIFINQRYRGKLTHLTNPPKELAK